MVAFGLGIAGGILWMREPTVPLTSENLAAARRRWADSGTDSYRFRYRMNHDIYEVAVENGIVVDVEVNGRRPRSEEFGSYSMMGLFSLLELELENLADPQGPFAGWAGSVLARVRYNERLGYLERYLRSAAGMPRGADIEILEFRPAGQSDPS